MENEHRGFDHVDINKDVEVLTYPFSRVFKGFDKTEAVRNIFGEATDEVLNELRVAVYASRFGYMWIDDKRGLLAVNLDYIRSADKRHIYLDVIHELVHIRQLREGKELFDESYRYTERPTEVEAYEVAIKEAKRIGLTREELVDYLKVEWVKPAEFKDFLKRMGV